MSKEKNMKRKMAKTRGALVPRDTSYMNLVDLKTLNEVSGWLRTNALPPYKSFMEALAEKIEELVSASDDKTKSQRMLTPFDADIK